jgi:hypothetical protein
VTVPAAPVPRPRAAARTERPVARRSLAPAAGRELSLFACCEPPDELALPPPPVTAARRGDPVAAPRADVGREFAGEPEPAARPAALAAAESDPTFAQDAALDAAEAVDLRDDAAAPQRASGADELGETIDDVAAAASSSGAAAAPRGAAGRSGGPGRPAAGDVAADGAAAGGSEVVPADSGTGAAALAAMREQMLALIARLPPPRVGRGGGGAPIETEAQRRARLTDLDAQHAATSAEEQVPPVPAELASPPPATEQNPVPAAMHRVQQIGTRRLPTQTPPALPAGTPLGNPLQLTAQPLTEEQLSAAHTVQPAVVEWQTRQSRRGRTPPEPETAATRAAAAEQRQQEQARELRARLLEPPAPPAGRSQPQALVDRPPRHAPVTDALRGQAADVYARLLAGPAEHARSLFSRVQRAVFPGAQAVGDYGRDAFQPRLQTEFENAVREVADKAGIARADLDAAVADRRRQLAEAEAVARTATDDAAATGSAAVTAAGERRQVATAGQHARLVSRAEATAAEPAAGIGGGVAGVRDRLLADVRARSAEIDATFRLSQSRREGELDDAATAQVNAYRAGAQVDVFQLRELAALSPARRAAAVAAHGRLLGRQPAAADTLTDGEIAALASRVTVWGQDQGAAARATLTGLKTAVRTETTANRGALRTATDQSVEEVRDWAAQQLGESRGFWTRFIERIQDWVARLMANANAWRAAQDTETAAATTDDLAMLARLQAAAQAGISRAVLLDNNQLTREQRELVDRFFAGGHGDALQIVADRTVERIFASRREDLETGLVRHFETDGSLTDGQIDALVGGGVAGRAEAIHAAMFGRGTWLGLDAIGTDENTIYAKLGGLTALQRKGLEKIYNRRWGDLDADLASELSGEELQRARDLASGDAVGAATAALYSAMHETFLGTGLGTDEATIHSILRDLTPEQRGEVERLYRERYGRALRGDMRGELDDWATRTTHEADRAEAEVSGNLELADAIELNQIATTTIFHTNTVNEMGAVYERLDREVRAQAQREGRSSLWVADELARRRRRIETQHDDRYATVDAGGNASGTLRQEFDRAATSEMMFWGSRPQNRDAGRDWLNALADGDEARAGAARIRIERTSLLYASDRVITDTYRTQYDRSLADARLDLEEGIRRRHLEALERADVPPNQLSPAERFQRLREIDRLVERELGEEARRRSEGRVAAMENAYQAQYHESAATVIEENTSGVDRDMARALRTQGGHLTPYQRLDFSTRGLGTREEDLVSATAGMTRSEIAELDRQWRRTHGGQSIEDLGEEELSGTDLGRFRVATMGVPQTIDEELEVLHTRLAWEWPTSGAGAAVATHERELMVEQYQRLLAMRDAMHRTDLRRDERDAFVDGYTHQVQVANTAVDDYRDVRNAIVDSITTGIGIIVGIVVGAVLTVLTAGAAAAVLVALIGSLVATTATMATKYLLLGNNYGSGDIALDVAIGIVDAVVSGLTAGMGGRLLGQAAGTVKAQATQITARGLRGALQRVGAGIGRGRSAVAGLFERGSARLGANEGLVTRMLRPSSTLTDMVRRGGLRAEAAQFVAAMAENLAQSAPSALIGAVADDDVWEGSGNPFAKVLSGTAASLGPGLLMGAGMHVGMRGGGALLGGVGRLARFARSGPDLDADLHGPHRVVPGSPEWHNRLAEYRQTWGSDAEARLRSDLELEHATATERFQRREAQRAPVREQLGELLGGEPGLAREVPIAVLSDVEFRRLNGLRRGDAMVHVDTDGQVRVVVREGAPPAAVRRALAADLPRLRDIEPGTGGRIRAGSLENVLPRDLRGRLPVTADPTLPQRTVRVFHDPEPRIVVGPGVRAADIRTHLQTARNALQLHGAFGRVRHLLDRAADWVFQHGEPPRGTRAFEAQEEVRKLPGVIAARRAELLDPDLTTRARAALEADIADLQHQLARHERTFAELDLSPGRGFIAAEGRRPAVGADEPTPHARAGDGLAEGPEARIREAERGAMIDSLSQRVQHIEARRPAAQRELDAAEARRTRRQAEGRRAEANARTHDAREQARADLARRQRNDTIGVDAARRRLGEIDGQLHDLRVQIDRLKGERLWAHHRYGDLGNPDAPPCFATGTIVATDRGPRPIESLAIGDLVATTDPATGRSGLHPVTFVHRNRTDVFVELTTATGDIVRATRDHWFWDPAAAEWVPTRRLHPQMVLDTGGERVALAAVRRIYEHGETWNLEVAGVHTFRVGRSGLLVHNGDPRPSGFTSRVPHQRAYIYGVYAKGPPMRLVYVGKTYETPRGRFEGHLEQRPHWSDTTHEVRTLRPLENVTDFDIAVWEQHYIKMHGGLRVGSPLENAISAITEEQYREHRRLHSPC